MRESTVSAETAIREALILRNWTCRLCSYSNPDSEDICCQRCGAVKK
ncbi:hypothetical protein LG943_27230 [Streptomonospora sp. S1-112]|uniref:RanBP2-type domain-containing protein n=2 Tax=Streptomonospora TaxID=104204 RepID=A0A853BV21_9ACTN|nr:MULTISPECIES: hypothetical protein [Streptomonospora]MBV2364876.1 hypothetical protein [Streptomonospora nanhaiensis]MBX9387157.1 hypothetical protein [Streptomonospora nanhaiensis]MDA0567984.1 hypothetical protein [Streptomonospora mangrovi]NYI98820.1 hypothetical protein [Streptomonospora nanhaiensis]